MLVVALGLEVAELAALEVVELAAELAAERGRPVVVANLEEPVAGQAAANLAVVLVPVEVVAMLAGVGLALGNHLELGQLASYPH